MPPITYSITYWIIFFVWLPATLLADEAISQLPTFWDQIKLQLGTQLSFRHSPTHRVATAFPFPPEALPTGQTQAFLETVEAGSHLELSDIILTGRWQGNDRWQARFKLEIVDLYDRNPTSNDHVVDMDVLWLRYGNQYETWEVPAQADYYVQIGKFESFERQDDRHLHSYGLLSTAFNRFEDSGIELGFNQQNGLYGIFAVTTGNPLFMRDVHALAGDNGTPDRSPAILHPNPQLKSGFPILYDAEIETFNLSEPQWALGFGWRLHQEALPLLLNGLLWANHRTLQPHQSLNGTFYGADLDLLDLGEVPGAEAIRLDIRNNRKTDYGINLAIYAGPLTIFNQYVHQTLAGMQRQGWETEWAYRWKTSLLPGFKALTPAIRYSSLDPDFTGSAAYPAPSIFWNAQKWDYGVRLQGPKNMQLTLEYSQNRFRREGQHDTTAEYLITFQWQYNLLP